MDVNLREVTSSAVLEEKKKLRKEFKYLDMIFYTLAALIGLDTIGAFASQFIPLAIIILLTIIFYIMGHSDKRNQDVFVDLHSGEADVGGVEGIAGK